jgi:hypothetical protein
VKKSCRIADDPDTPNCAHTLLYKQIPSMLIKDFCPFAKVRLPTDPFPDIIIIIKNDHAFKIGSSIRNTLDKREIPSSRTAIIGMKFDPKNLK